MELKSKIKFKYNEIDCEFRPLKPTDVTENYIQSLRKQEYIKMTSSKINKAQQRKYIKQIQATDNNFINGIFINGIFIGTSGVQLENKFLNFHDSNDEKIGLIGIFLFDENFIGKGFGKILVWASTFLFYKSFDIKFFGAGMNKSNLASLYSFKSCGYKICNEDNENYKVILNFNDLIQPQNIFNIKVL